MKIAILYNHNPQPGYIPQQTAKRYTAIGFNPIGIELLRWDGDNRREAILEALKYISDLDRAVWMEINVTETTIPEIPK